MILFGLKACDTCRKALKDLINAGFDPKFVDVRADGVSDADLARFYAEFDHALLNTRSTTWRGLSDGEREMAPLTLLATHPTLMKRPVIEHGGALSLGWSKEVQALYL